MLAVVPMGTGAYLAVKSEREVYEAEITREKTEVEENPEEEIEEMSLFYQLQRIQSGGIAKDGGASGRTSRANGASDGAK